MKISSFVQPPPLDYTYLLEQFQVTFETDYAIAIATRSDWLKNVAPVFQPIRSRTKTNHTSTHDFSRPLSKLLVISRNSDRLIALFSPFVIGRSSHFGIGIWTVI